MKLTDGQRRKLIDKLRALGVASACCLCASKLGMQAGLVEVREFAGGPFVAGGEVTPLVSLCCEKCGNTVLLNAIALGLVDQRTGTLQLERV